MFLMCICAIETIVGVGKPEVTLGDTLKVNLNFNQRENVHNDITYLVRGFPAVLIQYACVFVLHVWVK